MIIKSMGISFLFSLSTSCSSINADTDQTSLLKAKEGGGIILANAKTKELQLGNTIANSNALVALKSVINKNDAGFRVINVLHIGDSHIKSGLYSEPFMQKLNNYYGQKRKGKLFFNFQWFCKIGTKYSDYNELAELDIQLVKSNPNLVIISLGTNDAFSGSSHSNFYAKIDHLVQKIHDLAPHAAILITTPPDGLKNTGGYFEALPEMANVVNTITRYCSDKNIACWNLHQIMGGTYAINAWYLQKLAAPDRVHYSAKGYAKFAQWLFDAFVKAMN